MARTFNILVQVTLEADEVPADEQDWKAWRKIAQDELAYGEVYNVIEDK